LMNPFKELAGIIQGQAVSQASQLLMDTRLELGTITATGLKLDTFKHEIQDFLVAEWMATVHLPAFFLIGTATSQVDDQGTPQPGASTSPQTRYDFKQKDVQEVKIELRPGLKPGDRVLCVPVNGGNSIIVLCKVVT
jgi:hypothetical protein